MAYLLAYLTLVAAVSMGMYLAARNAPMDYELWPHLFPRHRDIQKEA